jgi:hypothetical protein
VQSTTGTLASLSHMSRWMPVLLALALATALAVPLAPARAQTQAADTLIDLVPESVYAFIQADLDITSDQAMLAAELFDRAGLASAIGEDVDLNDIPANSRFGVVVTSIPDAADFDVDSVAIDPMGATETLDDGGFAVIVAGDATTFIDDELESMQSNVEWGYGEIRETEYGGIPITVFESTDEYTDSSAIATIGEYSVFAMRDQDIYPLIDTFNGDTPSLDTNEQYQQLMAMLPSPFLSSGWVNGPALLTAIENSAPEAFASVDVESLAALDAVTAFTFTAEQQGFRLETRSLAARTAATPAEVLDGAFLDSVSADALFVTNGTNIDSAGLVTNLALLFASEFVGEDLSATPVADIDLQQTQDEVFARAEAMLGFNIKTDFIDNLTGEFGLILSVGDISSETPSVNALFVTDVSNPLAVQDVISKVSFILGAGLGDQTTIDTRSVNGSNINVVDLADTGFAEKAEFGVIGDELVISVGTGLDDYLNGPSAPLSEDESFNQLMANLPSEYTSMTYINMNAVATIATDFSGSMGLAVEDADEACGEFASQEEAQAAYDEDPFGNFMLDQNFDGVACEDYFALQGATPAAEASPYANILGLATVMTEEDGVNGSSSFFLIGGD